MGLRELEVIEEHQRSESITPAGGKSRGGAGGEVAQNATHCYPGVLVILKRGYAVSHSYGKCYVLNLISFCLRNCPVLGWLRFCPDTDIEIGKKVVLPMPKGSV